MEEEKSRKIFCQFWKMVVLMKATIFYGLYIQNELPLLYSCAASFLSLRHSDLMLGI